MFLLEYLDKCSTTMSVRFDTINYLLCTLPHREMQQHGFSETVYGELCLNGGPPTPSPGTDSPTVSVHLPVCECLFKRIVRIFFEKGFQAAVEALQEHPSLNRLTYFVNRLVCSYTYLNVKLCLSYPEIEPEVLARNVETRDWLNSIIRCIAWHPKCNKFAVASFDDIVRIYKLPLCEIFQLNAQSQQQITCMAWRPICGNEIAIGCCKGLIIWSIEKKEDANYQFVLHPYRLPIVSMQWNKNGTLLATASVVGSDIMLWEADRLKWIPLKCYGPPTSMIKWAPDSDWLFLGTTDATFCIWDCDNLWKPERWSLISGSMQSACWSPCGTYLIFVTTTQPFLYRIEVHRNKYEIFKKNDHDQGLSVTAIADLRQHTFGSSIVGGMPQQLAWDCDGRFLCITFKDSVCIAIYHTYISNLLQISPAFYIQNTNLSVFPSYICFQCKHSSNKNIVLSIGWSSGCIQHCKLASND